MASLPFSPLIFGISLSLVISLFSPVHSLTCASQKLPENRPYANCSDLPTLGATLHYTYNATNRSLSVAYAAAPPKPDGWVAWGINPTGGGMLGAGALIALKANGKVTVNTYNLTSYSKINQTKLSFDVWDLTAVDANGEITIFASLKLPEKADNLSQVWQVGPVTNGKLDMHGKADENLKAKAALQAMVPNTPDNRAYRLFSPSEERLRHKESRLRKNHKPTGVHYPSLSFLPFSAFQDYRPLFVKVGDQVHPFEER